MKNIKKILAVLLVLATILALSTAALASGTKTFVTTGQAHLREYPDKDSAKLGTLPKGTKFVATDFEKDSRGVTWYFGSYKDDLGWVSEKNLKEDNGKKPEPTPKPTPKPIDYSKFKDAGYKVIVTGNSVNLRREPSTDYAVVTSYAKGAVLNAIRTNGNWAEIWDENSNLHGYISEKYIEKYIEKYVEAKLVEPDPIEFNLEALEDGIYNAAFAAEDLTEGDGKTLENVHLFTKDTYDIVEIAQLSVGDTIVIGGEAVKVNSIERGELVKINGGLDAGGWNLIALDESNCFVVWDLDDAATYTDRGEATLEVSEDVVFMDNATLEDRTATGIEAVIAAIAEGEAYGYNEYNTTLRIEDGKIVEIARIYVP